MPQRRPRLAPQVFVDETKRPSYAIVAAVIPTSDLHEARQAMRGLLRPNQRRIHFKDERDSRKRQILDVITGLSLTARLYLAATTRIGELDARRACLRRLVPDIAALGAVRLVIERDESLATHDRRTLYEAVQKAACRDTLRYDLLRAHEENLLAVADAVAWCWSHRGPWRERVKPIITDVIELG